jgi:hypothetical protein
MNYGSLKVDAIVYTSGGADSTVYISGITAGNFNNIAASGVILTSSGSQSQPSVSFVNDPDTGLYNSGANSLSFSTSGTARIAIDASGNVNIDSNTLYVDAVNNRVGVGTSSPGVALHVDGDIRCDGIYGETDTNTSIQFPGSDVITFNEGGVEAARIDSSGRLGIGTTSPSTSLHLLGANTAARGQLSVVGNSADPRVTLYRDSTFLGHFAADTTNGLAISTESTYPIRFTPGGVEKARIDSSGRLLVGTSTARANFFNSSESARLQVEGTDTNTAHAAIIRNSDNSGYPLLTFAKTRGTSVGATTVVQNGDVCGGIEFQGSDGTEFVQCAEILAAVDGTPGSNDMPGRLVFSTTPDSGSSPVERLRINNAGLVMIGGTNATSGSQPVLFQVGESTDYFHVQRSGVNSVVEVQCSVSTTAARNIFSFKNPNGFVGYILTNGSATSFVTSSDYRLKENIVPLTGAVDRLNQLQVHRFNFIADPETTVDGFIAHEAQEVVPECVSGTKDELDSDGNPVYQGIDQSKLVPLLTAALQETITELQALKAEVAALKSA